MVKAIWNGAVLAQSDETIVVEGNTYFPPGSLNTEYFRPSDHSSVCGWKGMANYYDIEVNGQVNQKAAWYYDDPKPEAQNIAGHVSFWKGVRIESG